LKSQGEEGEVFVGQQSIETRIFIYSMTMIDFVGMYHTDARVGHEVKLKLVYHSAIDQVNLIHEKGTKTLMVCPTASVWPRAGWSVFK
jgi:hypothetical protein